ncbi:stalk domain-containing protein [Paenibacillus hamazuiensis]|uniref:stalk domain-containing protein n=1 Tax=Paenibacillus hamazuiensis TaxID=2936508 RepID=UPI00200CDDE6|nr:stalk domain-containing protein [Paenibacillus hamazuiensis]
MNKFMRKYVIPLLVGTAFIAAVPPVVSAEQSMPVQLTQAETEAARLLLDQGVERGKVERLGTKAEIAAYVLKKGKPDFAALNRLIEGLLKYADDSGYAANGQQVGGMLELNDGELGYSPGAPLEARMMSRKPIDVSLNGQPGVLAPWEEYTEPHYFDGIAYFPLYRMMTMFGGDAKWDGVEWEVTAVTPWGTKWKVPIGGREVRSEKGDAVLAVLSHPSILADNQVLVPFDFWTSLIGFRVEWDTERKSLSMITEPLYRTEDRGAAPAGDSAAGDGGTSLGLVMPDLTVRVNGREVKLTHLPVNYEGKFYYPVELIRDIMDLNAEYDKQSGRLTLAMDYTIRTMRSEQYVPKASNPVSVPVNIIAGTEYLLDGAGISAAGKSLSLSSPMVEYRGRPYAPINELAAIAGYQVSYTDDKTLHLNKTVVQRIREKLKPGISRDDVRKLLGNRLKVVYNPQDGTRSWEYRFRSETGDAFVEAPTEGGGYEKFVMGKLETVDWKELRDASLQAQLFVHHDPAGLVMSGYTLYVSSADGIREYRLQPNGSVSERIVTEAGGTAS